jgi:hypothetical protein
MNTPPIDTFVVMCRGDSSPDGTPGEYVLASRRTFPTVNEAHEYGKTVAPSRRPVVLQVVRDVVDVEETMDPHGWNDPEPADMDPLFGKPLT